PVAAGAVGAGAERRAVGLRAGQDVVAVRRIAASIDDLALLAESGLLGELVVAVQFGDVAGDGLALGVDPRPGADALAGVDGGLAVSRLRRQIGAPCFRARTGGLRQRLTMVVGAGEAAEVAAVADALTGDEEAHGRRLRRGGRGRREQCA